MDTIQKRAVNEVFADYMFVSGSEGQYPAPEGWYPVLGLPGSLDLEQNAVLFCQLQPQFGAALQSECLNGVIAKIRIHRSARVNGPDTMLLLASDLVREFPVCQLPIVASAAQLTASVSPAGATQVPAAKTAAYRQARYRFGQGDEAISLRIDTRSEALERLYAASGYDCGVFITAFNPLGRAQGEAANNSAHVALVAELSAVAGVLTEGAGSDPAGEWPAEKSCFGLGVDLASAKKLGIAYRQDAIVWAGRDAVPRLVLLR